MTQNRTNLVLDGIVWRMDGGMAWGDIAGKGS